MNHLSVSVLFDPGHVKATTYRRDDGSAFAVIAFHDYDGHKVDVHVDDLEHVIELEAALAEIREFLSNEAARDAA